MFRMPEFAAGRNIEAERIDVKGPKRPIAFDEFLRLNALHAVYVVTTADHTISKIGMADDPPKRFGAIQSSNFVDLELFRYWFVAGRPLSEKVEAAIKTLYQPSLIRGEWYRIPADLMAREVKAELERAGHWHLTEIEMRRAFLRLLKKEQRLLDMGAPGGLETL